MAQDGPDVNTPSNVISFEKERKIRIRKRRNDAAIAAGLLVLTQLRPDLSVIRRIRLNGAGAALFCKLMAVRQAGVSAADITLDAFNQLTRASVPLMKICSGRRYVLCPTIPFYVVEEGTLACAS